MNKPSRATAHDRILAVARREFAAKGYDGASVRAITTKAKVNLGAITYHFQSKELLYMNVLSALVAPMADRVRGVVQADIPPLDKVEHIVRAIFRHIGQNPDMPAIMMRELAGGDVAAPVRKVFATLLPLLAGIIEQGQREGAIRRGDPILLALSTIAQPVYLNLARPIVSKVAGVDPQDERVIEHAVATARAALRP